MADFCKQCSIDIFGEDYGDLKGIVSVDGPDYPVSLICEGCGYTLINVNGECVYDKCLVNHTKVKVLKGVKEIEWTQEENDIPF